MGSFLIKGLAYSLESKDEQSVVAKPKPAQIF